ncbi:MAG: hypothetical protein ACRDQ4_15945 [Pseudonocardiaceae bacterium]
MKHGAVRKLMRAATLSLLALGMTSGVAGAAVWAASPAMAQADGQNPGSDGNGSGNPSGGSGNQGGSPNQGSPTDVIGGIGGIGKNLGNLTGGGA